MTNVKIISGGIIVVGGIIFLVKCVVKAAEKRGYENGENFAISTLWKYFPNEMSTIREKIIEQGL